MCVYARLHAEDIVTFYVVQAWWWSGRDETCRLYTEQRCQYGQNKGVLDDNFTDLYSKWLTYRKPPTHISPLIRVLRTYFLIIHKTFVIFLLLWATKLPGLGRFSSRLRIHGGSYKLGSGPKGTELQAFPVQPCIPQLYRKTTRDTLWIRPYVRIGQKMSLRRIYVVS